MPIQACCGRTIYIKIVICSSILLSTLFYIAKNSTKSILYIYIYIYIYIYRERERERESERESEREIEREIEIEREREREREIERERESERESERERKLLSMFTCSFLSIFFKGIFLYLMPLC